jgi:hypothetical protein
VPRSCVEEAKFTDAKSWRLFGALVLSLDTVGLTEMACLSRPGASRAKACGSKAVLSFLSERRHRSVWNLLVVLIPI